MIRCLLLLAGLLMFAVLGDVAAPYRQVSLQPELVDPRAGTARPLDLASGPVTLDAARAETLRLRTESRRHAIGGRIVFQARGAGFAAIFAESESAIGLVPGGKGCSSADAQGSWTCQLPFRFRGARHVDLQPIRGVVTVDALEVEVFTNAPVAQTGIYTLVLFFAVLSLFGAVAGIARLPVALRADLGAALGATWMVISGGLAGAALLLLLAAHYWSLRGELRRGAVAPRVLHVVVGAALLFAAVKISAASWVGTFADPGALDLGVPLGFAFFLVRALDLSFRVATQELRVFGARDYARYMLFPATLTAGPIFTVAQFQKGALPRVRLEDWTAGAARIGIGFTKKLAADYLLAREIGPRLLAVFADPSAAPAGELWLMLLANAAYVYLDFSGYSDIAIGIGRQVGWRVPENFQFPVLARSMREFWRRWHITLSAWVARWVHFFTAFELRHSSAAMRAILPVLVSLMVIAMWHEMELVWVAWGVHHALGVLGGDALGRALAARLCGRWPRLARAPVYVAGMLMVWGWVALSHCFTLISDPSVALSLYGRALGALVGL